MPVGKTKLPRWQYDFSCKNCIHIQFIDDPLHHRQGMYCIKAVEAADAGRRFTEMHADDDRHLRCDCYKEKSK